MIHREIWYREAGERELLEAQRSVTSNPMDTGALARYVRLLERSGKEETEENFKKVVRALGSLKGPFTAIADNPPEVDTIYDNLELSRLFRDYKQALDKIYFVGFGWDHFNRPSPEDLQNLVIQHERWVTQGLPEVEQERGRQREQWMGEHPGVREKLEGLQAQLQEMADQIPSKEEWDQPSLTTQFFLPSTLSTVFNKLQQAWERAQRLLYRFENPEAPTGEWDRELRWVGLDFEAAKEAFEKWKAGT